MNLLDTSLPKYTRAQVAEQNLVLSALANRVYELPDGMGGTDFYLRAASTMSQSLVVAKLLYRGNPIELYLDSGLVDTLLLGHCLRLQEMSEDAIALFLLSLELPALLQIESLASKKGKKPNPDHTFELVAYTGNTPTGWTIGFNMPEQFAFEGFIAAFEAYLKGVMNPKLSNLPVALPLVAAKIDVQQDDVANLGVGDVLLIGAL